MSKIDARTTDVVCMDSGERLRRVIRIDVEKGVVWRHHEPPRQDLGMVNGFAEYPTRFGAIHPIHAGSYRPYLVHCYGRLP